MDFHSDNSNKPSSQSHHPQPSSSDLLSSAKVVVKSCDVADADSVSRVFSECDKELPPMRGIIHAGMVLKVRRARCDARTPGRGEDELLTLGAGAVGHAV